MKLIDLNFDVFIGLSNMNLLIYLTNVNTVIFANILFLKTSKYLAQLLL